MTPGVHIAETLATQAAEACRRAAAHLLSLQDPGGYWRVELTADTTLEADYILLEL